MPSSDEEVETFLEECNPQTQFVPQSDDDNTLWEVLEILAEKGNRYRVRWAGNDPATGKPWAPSWVAKEDCTDALREEWKEKKSEKEKGKRRKGVRTRESTASSKTSIRSTATSSAPTSRLSHVEVLLPARKRPHNVDAEDVPAQPIKRRKIVPEAGPSALSSRSHQRKTAELTESSAPLLGREAKIGPPRGLRKGRSSRNTVKTSAHVKQIVHLEYNSDEASAKEVAPESTRKSSPANTNEYWDVAGLDIGPVATEDLTSSNTPQRHRTEHPRLPGSANSIVSRMKPRGLGRVSQVNSPALARTSSNTGIGPQQSKPLGPIPIVSPSVFRRHLRDDEPPMSSIEEFSSPEKGSEEGLAAVFRRAKEPRLNKGKSRARTAKDNDTLRLHGLRVAQKAFASNRELPPVPEDDDQSPFFEPGLSDIEVPDVPAASDQSLGASSTIAERGVDSNVHDPSTNEKRKSPHVVASTVESSSTADSPQRASEPVHKPNGSTRVTPPESPQRTSLSPIHQAEIEGSLHSQSRDKQLEQQISDLRAEVQQLQQANNDLITEAKTLPELRAQLADLRAEATALRAQNLDLSVLPPRVEFLEAENSALEAKASEALELRLQVARLQEENVQLSSEKDKAPEIQTQLDALQGENKQLAEQCEALKREKADVVSLRDLFQEQYSAASAYVSEVNAKNNELEEDLRVAKGQVSDGLAMVRGTYTERVRRLEDELAKYKGLCKLLQDKDARTDDEVRRRAALEPELREENHRLRAALEKALVDCTHAQEAFERILHADDDEPDAVEPAAGPTENESDDDDSSYVSDDVDDNRHDHDAEGDERQMAPASAEHRNSSQTHEDGSARNVFYICQNVADGRACNARFSSPEDVRKHAYVVHYPSLLSIVTV